MLDYKQLNNSTSFLIFMNVLILILYYCTLPSFHTFIIIVVYWCTVQWHLQTIRALQLAGMIDRYGMISSKLPYLHIVNYYCTGKDQYQTDLFSFWMYSSTIICDHKLLIYLDEMIMSYLVKYNTANCKRRRRSKKKKAFIFQVFSPKSIC